VLRNVKRGSTNLFGLFKWRSFFRSETILLPLALFSHKKAPVEKTISVAQTAQSSGKTAPVAQKRFSCTVFRQNLLDSNFAFRNFIYVR
jgi:hypothetical protein